MASDLYDGVVLRWVQGPAPGFEDIACARVVPFDADAWKAADVRLQPGAGASYIRLAAAGEFGRWWPDRCARGDPSVIRRFCLQLPPALWERPWEGLVGGLDVGRWDQVSLIREVEADAAPRQPSELAEPLTVLCLQGAASGPGLATLDLAAEFAGVAAAYEHLDFAVRQAIAPPVSVRALRDSLVPALLAHRPAVLWFSGHGRADPPGLLLDDGQWLPPEDLATALRDAAARGGRTPLYAILWACQTAAAPRFAAPTAAPQFVAALYAEGVSALLASQAPLNDEAAHIAAAHIFDALASGRPLDHAAARVRGTLMRAPGCDLAQSFDWMCPVFWSQGPPPASLHWTDRREQAAQRQAAAHKLLPASLRPLLADPPAAAGGPPPWSDAPRLWIASATPGAQGPRIEWARRVLARQRQVPRTVLWFDLSSATGRPGAVEFLLNDWARVVDQTIEHDDDRSRLIRDAAQVICNDCRAGWRMLCQSDLFLLAIIEPPELEAEWLWEGIEAGARAQAIVLAGDYSPARAQANWVVDTLAASPKALAGGAPTLAALAVLGCPADRDDIEAAATEPLGPYLIQGAVIETSAGCLMPAGVAENVARRLSDPERTEGHRLAYKFLDGPSAQRKLLENHMREDLLLARWHHARAAALRKEILKDATLLLDLYQRQGRAAAFLGIFDTVRPLQSELPDPVRIGAGWAYLTEGKCDDAISWLETMRPGDLRTACEAADWGLARAEAEKSCGRPGSKANARRYLEDALAAIEEDGGEDGERLRLRCLHDLARLTHFFERNPAGAVQQYEDVARKWKAIPGSDLDRAITLRNLAEALMDCGRALEAEPRVAEARRLIPAWTRHPVVSELEYFAGRLAIKLGLSETEISRRFEDCRAKALTTSHLMIAAIVESRIFWRGPEQADCGLFDDVAWAAAARRLALFERHAWAARVSIDGHLRAARRLVERGERFPARRELAEARRIVEANPAFEEGSDRRRLAALYAGLELYEPTAQNAWDDFQQRYGWARAHEPRAPSTRRARRELTVAVELRRN